jgi:hypothetical protein
MHWARNLLDYYLILLLDVLWDMTAVLYCHTGTTLYKNTNYLRHTVIVGYYDTLSLSVTF